MFIILSTYSLLHFTQDIQVPINPSFSTTTLKLKSIIGCHRSTMALRGSLRAKLIPRVPVSLVRQGLLDVSRHPPINQKMLFATVNLSLVHFIQDFKAWMNYFTAKYIHYNMVLKVGHGIQRVNTSAGNIGGNIATKSLMKFVLTSLLDLWRPQKCSVEGFWPSAGQQRWNVIFPEICEGVCIFRSIICEMLLCCNQSI